MMNNNYKYLYVLGIIYCILSLYLISFSIYNIPSADDFVYGATSTLSPFSLAINDYFHGSSGRIFSNIMYYYFAGISNNNLILYKILPLINFAFFVFVSFLLFSIILKSFTKKTILSITSIFIFIYLISLDSMNDTIFWYGGIFNYSFPMSLMFLSIYLVLKSYYVKNKIGSICYILLSSIIMFISSFSNEALFLVFFVLYILIFMYTIYLNNKIFVYKLIPLLSVLLIAFFFVLFSPGSSNRAGGGGESHIWLI